MDLPKNSELTDPEIPSPAASETAEPPRLDHQYLNAPEAEEPRSAAKRETIELDISSDSDRESSDPVYRVLERSLSHDPYIALLDCYIADAHIAYRTAMRTAREFDANEYSARWEDRAFVYADRAAKTIDQIYKLQNRGQQKVVVEHRNDSDRQVRSPRQARQSVPRVHDASVNVPRKA
jgi:hypothetical protein